MSWTCSESLLEVAGYCACSRKSWFYDRRRLQCESDIPNNLQTSSFRVSSSSMVLNRCLTSYVLNAFRTFFLHLLYVWCDDKHKLDCRGTFEDLQSLFNMLFSYSFPSLYSPKDFAKSLIFPFIDTPRVFALEKSLFGCSREQGTMQAVLGEKETRIEFVPRSTHLYLRLCSHNFWRLWLLARGS